MVLGQYDPAASQAYHMPAGLRLQGNLDKAALKASLDRIVARHEALRTRFVNIDGRPQQVIAPANSGFSLLETDFRALPDNQKAEAVDQLSAVEIRRQL